MVDSLIKLYDSTATLFTTNGIGGLPDATSCIVKEERNGAYELTMTYPVDGKRYSELGLRKILFARPNPYDDAQPFRIYSITKPINGIVTVNAEHISYDLSGYIVSPFESTNIGDAFIQLTNKSVTRCPFTFTTTKDSTGNMKIEKPYSIRSLLGGTDGSILDSFGGGEYTFDRFNVKLDQNRGSNRGVSIRYGKNLTDISQEENCSSVYTGVYPYWYSTEKGMAEITEKVVNVEGTYDFVRILPLDLSSDFDDIPTEDELRSAATKYIKDNDIGVPKVSIDVSFIQLAQSEEYSEFSLLEEVRLCDTVNVEFPKLNVSATAKCISTEYDVLTNKYTTISLGDAKNNLASTIVSQGQAIEIQNEENKNFMEKAIANATNLITGNNGGFVVMRNSRGTSKQPDEILIMDTNDVSTAKKVWRWNLGGLGYSKTGVNGPFETAMTMDGKIIASFIQAGLLQGFEIKNGNGTFHVTSNGDATMNSGKVGVWNISTSSGALYSDVMHQDGYLRRVWINAPTTDDSWVISIQKAKNPGPDASKAGFVGKLIIYGDGRISSSSSITSNGDMVTNGSLTTNGDLVIKGRILGGDAVNISSNLFAYGLRSYGLTIMDYTEGEQPTFVVGETGAMSATSIRVTDPSSSYRDVASIDRTGIRIKDPSNNTTIARIDSDGKAYFKNDQNLRQAVTGVQGIVLNLTSSNKLQVYNSNGSLVGSVQLS